MNELLLVDGYNILNAWPELAKLKEKNFEYARSKLIHTLANFQALWGHRVIVVFDGHLVRGGTQKSDVVDGVDVVYTGEGETADVVIERLVSGFPGMTVRVASSDWTEQRVIFLRGAYRLPARELKEWVEMLLRDSQRYQEQSAPGSTQVHRRVTTEIKEKLERLRRE